MLDRLSAAVMWQSVYSSRTSEVVNSYEQQEAERINERVGLIEAAMNSEPQEAPADPDDLIERELKKLSKSNG
jgi:hypothetical protein